LRKNLLRRLALWFVPPLGVGLMWLLYLTSRKRWHFAFDDATMQAPFVVLFWHGELLMAPFIFRKAAPATRVRVMISDHFDGEIIARMIGAFDLGTLRGSSRRGAAKALITAIRAIEAGESVGITPDGPKGPRHSVSDGAIALAQKTGVPIVLLNCRPERYWQAASWDRFVIPKPFGTIDFYASEAIDVRGMALEEARAMIRQRLLEYAV